MTNHADAGARVRGTNALLTDQPLLSDLSKPENDLIEAFHDLARRALGQARLDGLIDAEYIESATPADLQVLGPACV
jgi:hypothetical protein